MSNITAARKQISDFLEKEIGKQKTQIRLVKITKTPEGWNGKVEVTEENAHLTKLEKPSVYEKNIYLIDLDEALNVTNYCQEGANEEY